MANSNTHSEGMGKSGIELRSQKQQTTGLESLLDLITSNIDLIDEADVLAHIGTSNHNILRWKLNCCVQPSTTQLKRDYKYVDFSPNKMRTRKTILKICQLNKLGTLPKKS